MMIEDRIDRDAFGLWLKICNSVEIEGFLCEANVDSTDCTFKKGKNTIAV
jgi:hypothetical protein